MTILIIPGLLKRPEFYHPLANELKDNGLDTMVLNLMKNTKNLKDTSELVLKYFEPKRRYDVIAHSYGGIVIKNILCNYPRKMRALKSMSFVSVPHGGSWQALFLSMIPAAREVLPFRKKIKRLNRVELPEATVNYLSEKELKVWPRKGGLLDGYIDVVIKNTDHNSIINSKEFLEKSISFIRSDFDSFLVRHKMN